MLWLIVGVLLWCAVHLIPSLAQGLKARLSGRLGRNGYRGLFSLVLLAAVALMVLGWRAADPAALYDPPVWAGHITPVLMLLSFLLIGAANYRTRVKRFIRHPQLTGVIVWAAAHLLANGDSRSLILFGGIGLWALVEIFAINAREGAWEKPEAPAIAVELRGIAISVVVFAAVLFLHPYFTGVSPLPYWMP